MGEPVTLRNITDTYVSSTAPNTKYHTNTRLWTKVGTQYAYIFFARPFPMGVNIINATLRLYNRSTWGGSNALSVRRISEKWTVSKTTWNQRPQVYGAAVSLSKSGAVDGTEWAFDITTEMQAVSDGVKWWGLRVEVDSATARALYSSRGADDYRPTLQITWADNPEAPEDLYPSGGRAVSLVDPILRCNFTDVSGDTTIQSIRVQTGTSENNVEAGTFVWDSGVVAVDAPELDLEETDFPGVAVNQIVWWRVRVQDGAGLWSLWSEAESFTRKGKGALTITNPAASPDNVVEDPTPPIIWDFSTTQRAYQVIIADSASGRWLWDSGKTTSAVVSESLPPGVLTRTDRKYKLLVRCWDAQDREATPGDPVFVQAEREFTYRYDASTDPVQDFTVTPNPAYPWVTLEWTRASAPDTWSIVRDNKFIEVGIQPEELHVNDLTYRYVDKLASGRREHSWRVLAIINGKTSDGNPTVSATPGAVTTCVSRTDATMPVLIFNPERDMEWLEASGVHTILGDAPPVLITQSQGGYAGQIAGRLADHGAVTAQEFKDRLAEFKKMQGRRLLLALVDEAFEAIVYNIQWQPVPMPNRQVGYEVSMEFYQIDQPSWG